MFEQKASVSRARDDTKVHSDCIFTATYDPGLGWEPRLRYPGCGWGTLAEADDERLATSNPEFQAIGSWARYLGLAETAPNSL